jgi:hypothetical protein
MSSACRVRVTGPLATARPPPGNPTMPAEITSRCSSPTSRLSRPVLKSYLASSLAGVARARAWVA